MAVVGAPPAAPQVNQFDLARQRAAQRATASAQQSQDALQRRFASMGALNSGASIKAQQLAQDTANQQREDTMQGIEAAQAEDAARKAEAQLQRDFTAGEAEKQRGWQGSQSDIDRAFQQRQFQAAQDQFLKQFGLQQEESAFNRRLAKYTAGHQGGLFGGGGFLGLGIGAGDAEI